MTKNEAEIKPVWSLKRFFAPLRQAIEELPAEIEIDDDFVTHHLRTVMRAKAGEQVVIVDELRAQAYLAKIERLEKSGLTLTLTQALPGTTSSIPPVTIAAALIKEQRWDLLLQKCGELGATSFQPILADRSVIKLGEADFPKKRERWQSVARSAAEQSEGLFIPEILPPLSVKALTEQPPAQALKLILKERGEDRQPMRERLRGWQAHQPVILAIGPEGGWTDAEFDYFDRAGFLPVILGERVLRSETAAIAAMAAVVYECASRPN